MIPTISKGSKEIVISTGNIITINSETLARKPNIELLESLKATLSSAGRGDGDNATVGVSQKLIENDRSEISVAVKIFLNKNSSAYIKSAVAAVLNVLDVEHVDNVVLAYHPNTVANATPVTPTPKSPCSEAVAVGDWSERNGEKALNELKSLYNVLEELALQKQILALGVADLDAPALSQLHYGAQILPTIAQINLDSCCVVPPTLHEYCNKHDIQLLTHADPELIMSAEQFDELMPGYTANWTVRYQVHLRCRGVLTVRGYIVGATKTEESA